ncbi:MAG: DUF58 domain-containing protein [Desulfurococcaceae archaeon]
MQAGSKDALYALLVLLESACFAMLFATYGYPGLALLLAVVPLALRKHRVLYISVLTSGFVLIALVNNVYAYIVSILMALVGSSYYILNCREGSEVKTIHAVLLIYTPLYVISPRTAVPAMASSLVYLIHLLREYLRLGKSHVYLFALNPAVHLNENADIALEVKCPGRFKYMVQVDDSTYPVKEGTDGVFDVIRVRATRLGVVRHVVKVILLDFRGLAKVVHGPYILEYAVMPKFPELVRQVERILRRYAEYVTVPLISIITLQPGLDKEAGGVGGMGQAMGVEGATHAVSDTTTKSKEYPAKAMGGIEAPGKVAVGHYAETASTQPRATQGALKHFEVKVAWRAPRKILERTIQVVKAYVGEYIGVRNYQPGDSVRLIHWKKSFRKEDVLDLAVKVYSSGEMEKRSTGGRLIVLADLTATSPEELDLLLQTLYSQLLSVIRDSGRALSELYLYLVTPRNETYFLKGKVVDILSALNALILEERYTSLYNYSSWPRINPPVKGKATGLLEQLVEYYRSYGHALVRDLNSWGLEKGSIILIHSKALGFKYYVIAAVLKEHGFAAITPGTRAIEGL